MHGPSTPPCCPPTLHLLADALRHDGYTDTDAVAALDAYLRRGTLAASDLLILRAHRGAARGRWIAGRWGDGAGPVAELAYRLGIGGEEAP